MTQINLIVNSLPRDLLEFTFFLVVGFTAGSVGLIWNSNINYIQPNPLQNNLEDISLFLKWNMWFYWKTKV